MSRRGLILLGAGGHARVVADSLREMGMPLAGCLAPSEPAPRLPGDVPWLGDDGHLDTLAADAWTLVNGIGSTRATSLRHHVFATARSRGFGFLSLIHRSATVSRDAVVGMGGLVLARAVVQPGARIGANVLINVGAIVGHDTSIGDHAHLAPGVIVSGGVTIGAGAHVGAGAVILEGISIGDGAVIGAGAVVLDDVPALACHAGNPARPLVSRS